jgi:hypothetical protein
MSREEDLIRSTTRAIASTIREVPPLQLDPAADELGANAVAPGRPRGSGRPRRWWSWGAPLIAAAVVVALAVSLVLVKDIQNGGAVPKHPATATPSGPDGAPRYYAALKPVSLTLQAQLNGVQEAVYVGDSVTGKTLATFKPPARTTFQSISAAADNRTFVVFAVTSSTGTFMPRMKQGVPVAKSIATLTGSWYKLRLAPGTAHPASLTRLPIQAPSWPDSSGSGSLAPGQIFFSAVSGSGQELAVADIPDIPQAKKLTGDWHEVRVYSTSTGELLRDWTEDNPATRLGGVMTSTFATVPTGTSALTWIDGDRAVALATSYDKGGTVTAMIRRLDMAGPANASLLTEGTVMWSGTLPWNQSKGCFNVDNWPPMLSADGTAISCLTYDMPAKTPGHVDFDTYPLVPGRQPVLNYRATILPENKTGGLSASVLWASPSADTFIVAWGGPSLTPATDSHFGVISHGKFTPLPLQPNRAAILGLGIVF